MYKRVLKAVYLFDSRADRRTRPRRNRTFYPPDTPSRSGAVKLEALDHNSARHRWRRALGLARRGLARRAH